MSLLNIVQARMSIMNRITKLNRSQNSLLQISYLLIIPRKAQQEFNMKQISKMVIQQRKLKCFILTEQYRINNLFEAKHKENYRKYMTDRLKEQNLKFLTYFAQTKDNI
ncbi:unnamed protein product (macronuclear) [Paramecium tetraurelia]|uniref:Uncharacterized protein n=1 Tax=Paramecium tetraurelia TaxID=5888 RepID=A0C056_PARTE|nr:uncharacterized protein GSPATT00006026001 [Paramecium tetraurelia]CAK64173.1 unnamed protein product [Paramecium tetraurelia]|eukprot:XP_001431571.1 hypothetical protein (macronuclear) [Paramecium tetraurelia strain d4-2]